MRRVFDIHKIKPVHGWREFVGEVGIIVLGVLIALSAEAALERWHWHEQIAQSREAMNEEIFQSGMNAVERLAVAPCLQARLFDLSDRLQDSETRWKGSPMYRGPQPKGDDRQLVVRPAYSPPSRGYLTDAWKNALSSGSFNHFSNDEANNLSMLFFSMTELDRYQEEEALAATRLSPLSYDRQLTDRDRSDALANIAEVDRAMSLMNTIANDLIISIRDLRLKFDRARMVREERRLFAAQRAYRGNCVKTNFVDLE